MDSQAAILLLSPFSLVAQIARPVDRLGLKEFNFNAYKII